MNTPTRNFKVTLPIITWIINEYNAVFPLNIIEVNKGVVRVVFKGVAEIIVSLKWPNI